MKKIILTAAIVLFVNSTLIAQEWAEDVRVVGSKIYNTPAKKDRPDGTPYAQPAFAPAIALNNKVLMRYNGYEDAFEFITKKNDTLVLDKIEDFTPIEFVSGKKYILTQYINRKKSLSYGYLLMNHQNGNFALLSKDNILLTEAIPAKTSFEKDIPARYVNMSKTYYFKNGETIITEFPDSKKGFILLFPDKKEAIDAFVKENKISFRDEKDMIKIINFIAK